MVSASQGLVSCDPFSGYLWAVSMYAPGTLRVCTLCASWHKEKSVMSGYGIVRADYQASAHWREHESAVVLNYQHVKLRYPEVNPNIEQISWAHEKAMVTIFLSLFVCTAMARLTSTLLKMCRSPYGSIWEETIDKPRKLIKEGHKGSIPVCLDHGGIVHKFETIYVHE